MTNRDMKRCSTLVTIRETKIKNIMGYHLKPVKMATLKYLQITNSGRGVEKREHIYIVVRNINCCNHYGKQYVLHAQLLQSCPALCYPIDSSPPESSVHGILQARILERAAMPSCRCSSWPRDQTHIFYVSWIGRWVLYHWATREAPLPHLSLTKKYIWF